MAAPLILRIIGDATSYLKTADTVIASNTEIGGSALAMGADFEKAAAAQVAAGTKSIQVQRAMVAELTAAKAKTVAGTDEQIAASVALERAQTKLNRTMGLTAVATGGISRGTKTAERDLNKFTRGVVAGSGVLTGLGRSLAFASSGFIAASLGAAGIVDSIKLAEELEKAQASLDVAIRHTGGSLKTLTPQYTAIAKAAAEFGISEADATTGLARATVLTGNASAAQRAYQEALVISKATGKDFNAVLTATSKGQEGITTSLRRYGILVDKTTSGTRQFEIVMKRFGGQAEANTTSLEKLHAQLTNALTTIGTALLPTVNRLATSFANWLEKMQKTGQLQRDVAKGMTLIHDVTGPLITDIGLLAKAFGLANDGLAKLSGGLKGLGGVKLPAFLGGSNVVPGGGGGGFFDFTDKLGAEFAKVLVAGPAGIAYAFQQALKKSPGVALPPSGIPRPAFLPSLPSPTAPGGKAAGPFGTAQPLAQYFKTFNLRFSELLAQAQAQLTKGTADDVRAAKLIITDIKKKIDQGQLHGQALLTALGILASAVGTVESAAAAAAQKQAAAAAAAKQKILDQIQNAIDPIKLEVALSRAQATGQSIIPALKDLLAAAYRGLAKALAAGKPDLEKQAYDQITSLKQQIKDAQTTAAKQFTEPLRLQIALARAQAFGGDTTSVLKQMKSAALKALHSGKYAGQSLINLLNEIANINSQLGSSTTNAYGDYKKASVKALTANLGLSADARRRFEQRLSQVGPGGTTPEAGTGAAGYVIDPATGRPIRVAHPSHRSRHRAGAGYGYSGPGGGVPHIGIDLNVYIDGHQVEASVTRNQQRRRRHNPTQTRGPNAATSVA